MRCSNSSASKSLFSSLYCSTIFSLISSIALYFSNLSLIRSALFKGSVANFLTFSLTSSEISKTSYSIFGSPISAIISSWKATSSLIASCPNIRASNISSSLTSFAPASTMLIASFVPATVRSISLSSTCSVVGLITNSPFTLPTLTAATGPSNGISEIDVAKDEPNSAAISGELS